jgi:hypothetical protein
MFSRLNKSDFAARSKDFSGLQGFFAHLAKRGTPAK